MKTTSKMKTAWRWPNEYDPKIEDHVKNCFPLPTKILPEIFLMTSHLDSHGTTGVKQGMLSGVQTGDGIQADGYDKQGIAHSYPYRKALHIYWGWGKRPKATI